MSDYTLALFAHIVGVLGLFAAVALDWVTVLRLRRAQSVALVREATSLIGLQMRLFQISALLLLAAGIYLTVTAWDSAPPWILVSLAALIVMGALSGAVVGSRLRAIHREAAAESSAGTIPPALQRRIADPILVTTVQTVALLGLGVVFVMTTKPDWVGSLIALAVAIVLGVVSGQFWRRPQAAGALTEAARPDSSAHSA